MTRMRLTTIMVALLYVVLIAGGVFAWRTFKRKPVASAGAVGTYTLDKAWTPDVGQLSNPLGIARDAQGVLYVADFRIESAHPQTVSHGETIGDMGQRRKSAR